MPPSVGSAGSEAVDLARIVGIALAPWQEQFLIDALSERPDGKWAAKEVGLNVPRQNGKGNILAARELAGLILFGDKLITHTAHQFDTAQEHFLRMSLLFETCPALEGKLKRIRTANGSEGIELMNKSRLNFKARSKGKGRGFSGDLVVFDEAMILADGTLDGLLPTMATRPNPQAWYVGSAPVIGPESDAWRGVIVGGRRPDTAMCYSEWSCEVGADTSDPDNLAASNPGLGVTISAEFVDQVERPRLSEDGLARERFGIWNPAEATPKVIPTALWNACADATKVPADPLSYGIEMTLDRNHVTIAACGDIDGANGVAIMDHYDGPDAPRWLVERMAELITHPYRNVCIDERSAAATEIPKLTDAGVRLTPCKFGDLVLGCAGFYDEIMSGTLIHPGDPVLDSAVAGAQKRDAGGSWLWDRKPGQIITPLVAATLARWAHIQPDEEAVDPLSQIY